MNDKTIFTETQSQMFTNNGDVKRYVGSEVVDEFNVGQIADISFPNGYNKGKRTHDHSPAINTTTTQNSFVYKEHQTPLRIRKLTPKECFRLMGFDDESFHRAEAVNSNTQLYKQAGNSIVVDVLEALFSKIFDEEWGLLGEHLSSYRENEIRPSNPKEQAQDILTWLNEIL